MRGVVFAAVIAATQWNSAPFAVAQESDADSTLLYFSGLNLWRDGGFLHGGLLWSPEGLDQEGFALKLMWDGGAYRYRSGALGNIEVTGRALSVFVLPGWRFKRAGFEVALFAGLEAQDHMLSPDDPSSRWRGQKLGLRGGFDLWYEPTGATMLAADASISSSGTYSARAALGWRFPEGFYVGPEAQVFACNDYRQYRLGLHVTSFKTWVSELSGAIGWASSSDHRAGPYGRLGFLVRR
jgi:hypothetical protein